MARQVLCTTAMVVAVSTVPTGHPAAARSLYRRVQPGERLRDLAQYFYGSRDFAVLLKLASHLRPFGGKRLRPGVVVHAPTAWTYRIRPGDTWESLAGDYLGAPRLGRLLARDNGKDPSRPPVPGHVVVIPALVRFVPRRPLRLRTLLRLLTKALPPADLARLPERIRRYNGLAGPRLPRGQTVLVPLYHVRVRSSLLPDELPKPDPGLQRRLREPLREVSVAVRQGDYAAALARGLPLLVLVPLAGEPGIRLCVELATALVALGQNQAARTLMRLARRLSGGSLKLDPALVSPKVRGLLAPRPGTRP